MRELYDKAITDASLKELKNFAKWMNEKVGHIPLIVGGWAAYAYVRGFGSKDIDVIFPGEAAKAVSLAKYPPIGRRSVSKNSIRATLYGANPAYIENANENTLVIVQIESKKGCANLSRILDVPGIDGVFIGIKDLAADMGYFEGVPPAVMALRAGIEKTTLRKGKILGGVASNKDETKEMFQRGYSLVSIGSDVGLIGSAIHSKVMGFR